MPRRKGTRTQKKKTSTKRADRILPELNLSKSYTSLAYGVLTVLVLFLLIYAGIKIFSHKAPSIDDNGANTKNTMAVNNGRQYIVKPGDNLWSISEKEYGTGYNWQLIAKANNLDNPGEIEKGQKLTIPPAPSASPSSVATTKPTAAPTKVVQKTTPTPSSTPVSSTSKMSAVVNGEQKGAIKGKKYTVQKGDYLWEIAQRTYGDPYRWVDIAKANNLVNPDLIFSGNVLTLPRP